MKKTLIVLAVLVLLSGCALTPEIDKRIKEDPDVAQNYYDKGKKLYDIGFKRRNLDLMKQAINNFNLAIEIDAEHTKSYVYRGFAYLALGDDTNGCSDMKRAKDLGMGLPLDLVKTRDHVCLDVSSW